MATGAPDANRLNFIIRHRRSVVKRKGRTRTDPPESPSFAEADAHILGDAHHLVVSRHELGLARDLLEWVVADLVPVHADRLSVVLIADELGGMHAKARGEHAVVGAGGAAALDVAGHNGAGLDADHRLQLLGDARGNAAEARLRAGLRALLFLHVGLCAGHCALGHGEDGEVLAAARAGFDRRGDLFDVIGDFGHQQDVRPARDTGVERQPAGLVAHNLDDHAAPVAGGGGMDAVDDVRGDVHGRMEAERHIGHPDVVVDRLGQADDVEPFLAEQVGGLVRAVAAQAYEAVELHALVVFLHGLDLVDVVLADDAHVAVGRALGAQDRAAQRQNAGKLLAAHGAVVALNQAAVAILNADDLGVEHGIRGARNAANGGVEARAIAAAGQDADSSLHLMIHLPPSLILALFYHV